MSVTLNMTWSRTAGLSAFEGNTFGQNKPCYINVFKPIIFIIIEAHGHIDYKCPIYTIEPSAQQRQNKYILWKKVGTGILWDIGFVKMCPTWVSLGPKKLWPD